MIFINKSRLILLPIFLLSIYFAGSIGALSQSSTVSPGSELCCCGLFIIPIAIIALLYLKMKTKKNDLQNAGKLAESKDLAGIDTLVNLLNDNSSTIRNDAAVSLQNYGIQNIEPVLSSILKYMHNDVRASSSSKRPVDINVIIKNKASGEPFRVVTVDFAPETISSLIPLLKSSDKGVRDTIANVLLEFNSVAVEPLIMTLNGPDKYSRVNALYVLGEIKDIRSVDHILNALKDEDIDVRNAAAAAIKGFNISAIPKERETIREIVKVPCKYCGTLVEVTSMRCPSCGAPLKP